MPDIPSRLYGYKRPPDLWNPLDDQSLSHIERIKAFNRWITGYFSHGNTLSTVADRVVLTEPCPTIDNMTQADFASSVDTLPAAQDQSDFVMMSSGVRDGLYTVLKDRALFPRSRGDKGTSSEWDQVEFRALLCDAGPWEMPCGRWNMEEDVNAALEAGEFVRPIKFLTLKGANHYVSCTYFHTRSCEGRLVADCDTGSSGSLGRTGTIVASDSWT